MYDVPDISVIICTMGSAVLNDVIFKYLEERVTKEVIVVIDNPEYAGICEVFDDDRVRVIRNIRNMGQPKSRNIAIEQARSEIIAVGDDDDIPIQNRCEKLVEYFKNNESVQIAYSFALGVDERTGRSWSITGPENHEDIAKSLEDDNFIVHSSVAYRRSAIRFLGCYGERFRYSQDYDLFLRAIRSGLKFGCVPEELIERHYSIDSITIKRRKVQLLYAFSAKILYIAETKFSILMVAKTIVSYSIKLLIPEYIRGLRRSLGYGK